MIEKGESDPKYIESVKRRLKKQEPLMKNNKLNRPPRFNFEKLYITVIEESKESEKDK